MKFSELSSNQWFDLSPYLDTCFLPVSGLSGNEPPHESAERIAETGNWLQPLETAFRGRTVTMPAYHYFDAASHAEVDRLNDICIRMRGLGFKYVVVVSGQADWAKAPSEADLLVKPEKVGDIPNAEALRQSITSIWKQGEKAR
ncbi:DUF2487 family protein [Cohnella sp. AR92]|uniref:DUF2487 family protein n=1 Tax=Cohnella sp. AR92 TaxID=648716 RepID=UPI001315694E|nr:DUF2487 family protein [Cohnella sp. AR92]